MDKYHNSVWLKIRKQFFSLAENQFCRYCLKEGRYTKANVADHIIPHRGDSKLFHDFNNLQPLCKFCHNKTKKREEVSKYGSQESYTFNKQKVGFL